MQSLRPSEIALFTGGVDTVEADYMLHSSESISLVNVDIREGTLRSRPTPLYLEGVSYPYFYEFNGIVHSFPSYRYNVIWDNKWYWTDGAHTGKVLPNGAEKPLGLPTPAKALTITADGDGPHTGLFKYTYTFYDTETGTESAPAPLPGYLEAVNKRIKLEGFEDCPIGADAYRIYRIGGFLPGFFSVKQIPGTSFDFLDDIDDLSIEGSELQTMRNGPPPSGISYFTELNGRMYGAAGNKLYYSALGNPDSWYIYNWILMPSNVRGIAKTPGGLLIMGDDWTKLLRGTQPENFVLKEVSNAVGCVDGSSIAYIGDQAIWLAKEGLITSNGYALNQLTANKVEEMKGLQPVSATTLDQVYYLLFKPYLMPSETLYPSDDLIPQGVQGTTGIDRGIVMVDFKRGRGYSLSYILFDNMHSIGLHRGELMAVIGSGDDEAFPECDTVGFPDCLEFMECSSYTLNYLDRLKRRTIRYFTPRNDLYPFDLLYPTTVIGDYWWLLSTAAQLTYISPLFIDGTRATLKEYDKVRIVFKGVFRVRILFDNDRVVQDVNILSIDESTTDFVLIGIPNTDDKANSIRFIIEGIGAVESVQYTYKFRELP